MSILRGKCVTEERDGQRGRGVEGDAHSKVAQQTTDVAAPAYGDGSRAECVFEAEGPADDPGRQFAERGVAIGVGAAGDGNHRRELGIAEAGKDAPHSGDHEREHDGGTGKLSGGGAGEHEDARADNGANAQRDEVHRTQRAPEGMRAFLAGLKTYRGKGLDGKKLSHSRLFLQEFIQARFLPGERDSRFALRDHTKKTGTPSSTITSPGHVYCGW